jgi:hypothetical protein
MLEPWIIEQIRRREEEERRRHERPQLEIPIGDERWRRRPHEDGGGDEPDHDTDGPRERPRQDRDNDRDGEKEPEGGQRGVVIIDM